MRMPTIDLQVPFEERHLAKALGARWDSLRRVWYVGAHRDLKPFQQWLPPPIQINLRSPAYFLLIGHRDCWRCHAETAVFGFALPGGHEALEYLDEEDADAAAGGAAAARAEPATDDAAGAGDARDSDEGNPTWVRQPNPEIILWATYVGDGPLARMAALTKRYRADSSGTIGRRYHMNHCEHCDAKLGDFDTIEEFDAALNPLDCPMPERLTIIPVDAHFEADAATTPLRFAASI